MAMLVITRGYIYNYIYIYTYIHIMAYVQFNLPKNDDSMMNMCSSVLGPRLLGGAVYDTYLGKL